MPYQATIHRVMIASPSDVAEERQIIREVVNEWNAIHSSSRGITLLPVGWETHSAPEMGDRAQSIINRRLLEDCDLLVGAFWTRIGTPTGESVSGTVEEIERHIDAGKPTMLYFSSVPVIPESIDREQFDKLTEFKQACFQRGLVESYATREEFRQKFTAQLAITLNQHEYFGGTSQDGNGSTTFVPVPVPFDLSTDELEVHTGEPEVQSPLISAEARQLLLATAGDRNGRLLKVRTMSGLTVQAGRRNFTEGGDPRTEALWEAAVFELCDKGLFKEEGYKGEVYSVTHLGYQVADKLGA